MNPRKWNSILVIDIQVPQGADLVAKLLSDCQMEGTVYCSIGRNTSEKVKGMISMATVVQKVMNIHEPDIMHEAWLICSQGQCDDP